MATQLTVSNIRASVNWDYQNVISGLSQNTVNQNGYSFSPSNFTDGTGAGNCNRLYVLTGTTISASSSTTITFTNLTDYFGNTVSFLRLKLIWIQNGAAGATTGASTITVGNATNPIINWVGSGAHTVKIRLGGLLYLVAGGGSDATGYAITASTADQLKITNDDGSNACTLYAAFAGCSA